METKREILKLRWQRSGLIDRDYPDEYLELVTSPEGEMQKLYVDTEEPVSDVMEPNQQAQMDKIASGGLRKPISTATLRRMALEGRREAEKVNPEACASPDHFADKIIHAFCAGAKEELDMEMYRKPIHDWIVTNLIPKIFFGQNYLTTDETTCINEYTIDLQLPKPYEKHYAYGTAFFKRNPGPQHWRRLDEFKRLYQNRYEDSIRDIPMAQMPEKMILICNVLLNDALLA